MRRGLQPAGFSPCKDQSPQGFALARISDFRCLILAGQLPQAEARATQFPSVLNQSNPESFSASSHFTILPTSCARSRGQSSSASSVSTTIRSRIPTAATSFFGLQKKFPCASSVGEFSGGNILSRLCARAIRRRRPRNRYRSSPLPRAARKRWARKRGASPVRGLRSPRKYFRADGYTRASARS